MSNNTDSDWSSFPGRLVILSGPSGSGKSTIASRLIARMGGRLRASVSATTRAPRSGERPNIDYVFVSPQEFEALKHDLLEFAEVHGNSYGTPAEPARKALREGCCVLLVIDVQGGFQVKKKVPEAVSIFLEPPSLAVLEQRLRERGTETPASLERRLKNAQAELAVKDQYDYQVTNDDLDRAVEEMASILSKYGCPEEPAR